MHYLFFGFNSIAQNNISSYQYWFDNDYYSQIFVAVPPIENLDMNAAIPLEDITNGLHKFNIRFKDENGFWSIISSNFFYYNDLTSNNINSYQYWFDNDFSLQTTEIVSTTGQLLLNTSISLEAISNGLHVFNIRFKDDKGTWSIPQSQYFYYNNLTESSIIAYEYWFDNSIDNSTFVGMTPIQHAQLTEMIPIGDIGEGLHLFSIRFKDDKGTWSVPVNQYFYKTNHVVDNEITAYRYWINDDINNAIIVPIDSPAQLLNLSEAINFPGLGLGDYTIHFQFKDTSDNWSIVTSDDFTITSLSILDTTFEKQIIAYPNPTKRILNFDLGEGFSLVDMKIYNQVGKLIEQETYRNAQKFKLNVEGYSNGIYFLIIIADANKATLKFIKF